MTDLKIYPVPAPSPPPISLLALLLWACLYHYQFSDSVPSMNLPAAPFWPAASCRLPGRLPSVLPCV